MSHYTPSFSRKSRLSSAASWVATREILLQPKFIAVDFETANRQGGLSACQISLSKVSDGQIIDRFTSFICPPPGYQHFDFTYLHGIDYDDVADAPTWSKLRTPIADFAEGLTLYAHNASFDAGVWKRLDQFIGYDLPLGDFYCTYRTTKSLIPGLVNYKLPTVVSHLVPNYRLNHHRADSDADACALIVVALQNMLCANDPYPLN